MATRSGSAGRVGDAALPGFDRLVAPEHQRERETIGIIGESLYATCRQPRLPGVNDMDAYHPVKPVLAEIQRDFDEQEISGG